MHARRATALVGIVLAVALVLGACSDGDDDSTPSKRPVCADCPTYGETDTSITATAGERFVIELESNVTTGYAWVVQSNADPSVVKKTASQYLGPENGPVGAGGTQRLVFEARSSGTTTVVLRYEQSFDPDPADRELTYAVTVT
jgi:predicted secreted protein